MQSLEDVFLPERDIFDQFFDIFFSLIAIIILLPFMVWKFATMLRNSPNMSGGMYIEKNDPRILPMGQFLRKTKVNELPQLLNILAGEMSIIGYRPLVVKEFKEYPEDVKRELAMSRPGLAGIGSIVFRDEEEMLQKFSTLEEKDKFYFDVIMSYKGQLEVWYIKHENVFMYWRLIAMTFEAILKRRCEWKKLKDSPMPPRELEKLL